MTILTRNTENVELLAGKNMQMILKRLKLVY